MAKFETQLAAGINEVAAAIHDGLMASAHSMRFVDESVIRLGAGPTVVARVYDQYFMRNDSRASLTVVVAGEDGDVVVSALSAGGGKGVVFNFDWGVEDEMVRIVQNILAGRFSL